MNKTGCTHLDQINVTTPTSRVCAACVERGDSWVHLRLCLQCGHIGCCDSSKNKHATAHHGNTKHPLIRSIEPDEAWVYCYVDRDTVGELDEGGAFHPGVRNREREVSGSAPRAPSATNR